MTGHSTKTNPDLSLFAVQRKLHTFASGLSIRTFHLKQALTMFTVISIMFAGTVIGRLLRNTGIPGKMGRPISLGLPQREASMPEGRYTTCCSEMAIRNPNKNSK